MKLSLGGYIYDKIYPTTKSKEPIYLKKRAGRNRKWKEITKSEYEYVSNQFSKEGIFLTV